MQGTNALVRKVHASVPGIQIEEDDQVLKFIANPSFMPKGLPSAHVETYDKSHATSPSWVPRRDLRLVSGLSERGSWWWGKSGRGGRKE